MSNTSTPILFSIGSGIGKGAAYCVHGTALASTQLALGAQAGYTAKAAELRTQRLALAAPPAPAPRQRKLATAS